MKGKKRKGKTIQATSQEIYSANKLLPKEEFLKQKKINIEAFEKTGLKWDDLTKIYDSTILS